MKTDKLFSNKYLRGVLLIASGLLLGWIFFHNSAPDKSGKTTEVHEHADEGKEVWTCSMHPQIRKDEPGDCPICGMDLIPLPKSDAVMDDQAIEMSESAIKLAEVQTSVVTRGNVSKELRLYGKIQADERMLKSQTAHIPGRIEQLLVNVTGENVNKGQLIAKIYSPELLTAQKELQAALTMVDKYPELLAAAREKLRLWKLSEQQIADIEKSATTTTVFDVFATTSGIVTNRKVNPGDYVSTGDVLFEMADLSRVWALFDAYESDLAWISPGQNLEFTAQAIPGKTFRGKITFINPMVNASSRITKVRVEVPNPGLKFKPEMFVNGIVQSKQTGAGNQLIVPQSAVLWTGTRSVVYVKLPGADHPTFKMREITLGSSMKDTYVVINGLDEGEEIVTNGTFSVDAAAQLAGKTSMINPSSAKASEGKPDGGKTSTGYNQGESSSNEGAEGKEKAKKAKPLAINKQAKEALQPLYTAYLKWKDALTNDDFSEAQKMATNMKSAVDKINMSLFKGDAHNAWMDFQSSLSKSLEHIQHISDIKKLRKAFQPVSATMIEMTTTFNPLDGTIYVQHCPMADNNKGADWLSKEKEIRNPYFGSSMLTCGEVTKEIK